MQVKRDLPLMMQKVDAEEEEKKNKEKQSLAITAARKALFLTQKKMKLFYGTVLLDQAQKEWVASIIPKFSLPRSYTELIYKASRDGWSPQHFHEYCDNKGNTLTLI